MIIRLVGANYFQGYKLEQPPQITAHVSVARFEGAPEIRMNVDLPEESCLKIRELIKAEIAASVEKRLRELVSTN